MSRSTQCAASFRRPLAVRDTSARLVVCSPSRVEQTASWLARSLSISL